MLVEFAGQKHRFYPENNNSLQEFQFSKEFQSESPEKTADVVRVVFEDSTDIFGRIVVYQAAFYSSINAS